MIFTFPRNGIDFKVVLDEPGIKNQIQVDRGKGTILVHKIDWVHISLDLQVIKVDLVTYATDQEGTPIKGSGSTDGSFNAVEQETWDYFYLPSRNGDELVRMIINGALLANYEFMIFDPTTGEFYPPIWFTSQVDETGQQVEIEGGTVYQKTGGNLTVTVTDGPGGEYTYQLNEYQAQASNIFENLPPGTHTITVKSSLSPIPLAQTVTI